ncbi:helix-turn-helix transcriptional regulator [Herbidospora yilanensis]|uniref:helix-turn-helix transcriptional regulator n=1 Tax=Herbidospora yilanensis TaxID=354426 RepID=UPI0012FCC0AB|nr:helix-turn-helix transcriptional regulator [Herbidospora yilanensis]
MILEIAVGVEGFRNVSAATLRVLRELESARGPVYGSVLEAVWDGGDNVYPLLKRLTDRGWLVSERDRPPGRRRRLYRLTTEGRRATLELLAVYETAGP